MSNYKKLVSFILKSLCIIALSLSIYSCIPLQTAPKIDGAKVYKGQKFKKFLPKQYVYVFEDPKDANEFYIYINAKYNIDYDFAGGNVPIYIKDHKYYLSFYEVERTTKTVNLIPIAVDVAMDSKGKDPLFEDSHISRSGSWYIALTVTDEQLNDLLKETDPAQKVILKHLDHLRQEYLTTANYMEVYLRNN